MPNRPERPSPDPLAEARPPSRDGLVAAILAFIGGSDLLTADVIRAVLEREIDAAGPAALVALKARLGADDGWAYYPSDPLARRIHHLLADRFLEEGSRVVGLEHLAAVAGAPLAIFANHLSYADANVVEVLLHRAGATAVADRLTAIAGPKVFSSRERRFSSLCFGTIKVPQSADVASGEAQLQAREVARAARQAIDVALGRLSPGTCCCCSPRARAAGPRACIRCCRASRAISRSAARASCRWVSRGRSRSFRSIRRRCIRPA